MMPQRASRRRIRSIRACIVNLLSVVRTIVDGGEAGAVSLAGGYAGGASRAPGALRARGGRAFPTFMRARCAESFRAAGSRPRAEGPRRAANNSLDVAEIFQALADLFLLLFGVGGVLGGLGRGRRGGFGAAFSHAGLFLPGRPRRRRARSRSGPDAAGGRGR